MSNGFKDFSLRSLLDQYKIVNSIDGNGTLASGGDFFVYSKTGVEGLLEKLTIILDYEDITEDIELNLYIDDKYLVYMPLSWNYANNQKEFLGKYLKITKQDYGTLRIVIELISPIVIYSEFVLALLAFTSFSDTNYDFTLTYLTREPITIYG